MSKTYGWICDMCGTETEAISREKGYVGPVRYSVSVKVESHSTVGDEFEKEYEDVCKGCYQKVAKLFDEQ